MVLITSRGKRRAPRKTLVYGVPGVGKSTLVARWSPPPDKKAYPGADKVAFISTEEGTNDIDCTRIHPTRETVEASEADPVCRTYAEFLDCISQLYSTEHDLTDVVVDSGDWLEKLIHADIAAQKKVATIAEIDYGKGYEIAMSYWSEVLAGLEALRRDRGMWIWLVAHAQIERFNDPDSEPYDRYSPNLHKKASHAVREWCDEVLFVNAKTYTEKTDEGFGRKRTRGVGKPEPKIYTRNRPAFIAKNRLDLPEEIPLDWGTYAHYAGITA